MMVVQNKESIVTNGLAGHNCMIGENDSYKSKIDHGISNNCRSAYKIHHSGIDSVEIRY